MLSKASFEVCPSCACHVARGSVRCPHCDRVLERTRGRLQPALVAVMMGLGAVAAASTACSEGPGDDGAGGEAGVDDDGDGTDYPSAVSTYGVGPSSTTNQSSSSGVLCPGIEDGTPCGECLALSCCTEAVSCERSQPCIDARDCLDACDPNDLACATTCQEAHPDGFALYQALYQCASASCAQCSMD